MGEQDRRAAQQGTGGGTAPSTQPKRGGDTQDDPAGQQGEPGTDDAGLEREVGDFDDTDDVDDLDDDALPGRVGGGLAGG